MGALLLEGVLAQDSEVDFFTTEAPDLLAKGLRAVANLKIIRSEPRWSWDKWYSRKPFRAFISGTLARTRAYDRLIKMLLKRHAQKPYDCIFQVSQTELFRLGRNLCELPPVVVYPCVHAAGELRWHRRESAYARQSEKWIMHYLTRLIFIYRSGVQKREVRKPALILGMSRRFNELLSQDYKVDSSRQAVLYHPIRTAALDHDLPKVAKGGWREGRPVRLLYVSRISVRKGVDQIIELSHCLDDLYGQIQIDVIGDRTQWSDYTAHLKNLNPRTASFLGGLGHDATMAAYADADILLLPSMYEPGGIVVGEALSLGVCVVVSDEVGSAEAIEGDCCRKFPAGNFTEFERQTRALIEDIRSHPQALRAEARAQAVEWFAPDKISNQLFHHLTGAVAKRKATGAHLRERTMR